MKQWRRQQLFPGGFPLGIGGCLGVGGGGGGGGGNACHRLVTCPLIHPKIISVINLRCVKCDKKLKLCVTSQRTISGGL